jgi:hypothetical protein
MTWFDASQGRPLVDLLREAITSTLSGVIDVTGRSGSSQVYFQDGKVVYVSCDGFLPLVNALELSGAAPVSMLGDLAETAKMPWRHREIPAAVKIAVRELTEVALHHTLVEDIGQVRVTPAQRPPLGVLMSAPLDELVEAASVIGIRGRVTNLVTRDVWRPLPAGQVRLSGQEWDLVLAMTSPTGLAEIARRTGKSEGEVHSLLARLGERGLVQEMGGRPAEERASASPTPATVAVAPVATVQTAQPSHEHTVMARSVPSSRGSALRRLIGAVRAG